MKWPWVALVGFVILGFVGLTGIDKYDERTCSQSRVIVQSPRPGSGDPPVYGFRTDCDGFLPW